MPRYALTIEYDGTEYYGWQKQDGLPTIQGELEAAVAKLCGEITEVYGSGRTDAGVHALGQVAHVTLPKTYDPFAIAQAVNFYLQPHPIAVLQAEAVDNDFHARFSASYRRYRYCIRNRRAPLTVDANRAWHIPYALDVQAMRHACDALIGHHDFTSFRDSECQAKSPEKTLDVLDIASDGEHIVIHTQARSFLHHQVRIMVGTLVMAGSGKWTTEDVKRALDARSRSAAGPTAPACGLYLEIVGY